MRIRRIVINNWRHFENIRLELDSDAPLVCIIGANGTGKSHILELIASSAHDLGLSPGVDNARGSVYSDPHDVELVFYLAPGVSAAVDEVAAQDEFAGWDRTLEIRSILNADGRNKTIVAGGLPVDRALRASEIIIDRMRTTEAVHFLSLDADRSYPKRSINANQIAEAYEIDWAGTEYTKGRSFRPSATLYDEWIKYFLAKENQAGARLMQENRRAAKAGTAQPIFSDHFSAFAAAVQNVLPHMTFTGVDSKARTLLFDTTGLQLSFNQLSGGEREIAFQIGQIDRFALRQGLFLLDEPELHLNADLIRQWVSYLTNTVQNGQIWLATHSLEAVEAAGATASFILERNDETRKVDNLARLDTRPVLSALSRAVGTPAFSISQLKFVYVEGEERLGERERFRRLSGMPVDVRFMEGGSCSEVVRRLVDVTALAAESGSGIRIGAIVDRDFRSAAEIAALAANDHLHVLPVLECENLFLHPPTIASLNEQNGHAGDSVGMIKIAADGRAGAWIYQFAMATRNAKDLPSMLPAAKEFAKGRTWPQIAADHGAFCASVSERTGFEPEVQTRFSDILDVAVRRYERVREEADLWKECEGKQVLIVIAPLIGFSNADTLIQAAAALWERTPAALPPEVIALREFVASL